MPRNCFSATANLHLPLPEICFGNNKLTLERAADGLKLEWDTLSALKLVDEQSGVKVAHAAEWAKGSVFDISFLSI